MEQRKITFIGAGNMAKAIIGGLVQSGYPAQLITVCAPSTTHRDELAKQFAVNSQPDNIASAAQADVIILAVKPQLMAKVCQDLQQQVDFKHKLIISIAAGVTVERFQQLLGDHIHLVRIMPNTPALIGKGMAGMYANPAVTNNERQFADDLMQSVGRVCWVKQEAGINQIIAIAGSAPAYFFLFMQGMQEYAIKLGFSEQEARLLIQQTALGATQMVEANPQLSLAELREQVTSKGGTTAEAIRSLNANQLTEIVAQAMQAAMTRANEMEKLF